MVTIHLPTDQLMGPIYGMIHFDVCSCSVHPAEQKGKLSTKCLLLLNGCQIQCWLFDVISWNRSPIYNLIIYIYINIRREAQRKTPYVRREAQSCGTKTKMFKQPTNPKHLREKVLL